MPDGNQLVWNGRPGHYEVHYLTLTDAATGVGIWIRYTLRAPAGRAAGPPESALWFLAMDPRPGHEPLFARRETFPVAQGPRDGGGPFELRVGPGRLTDQGACGQLRDCSWELRFLPSRLSYRHVHPLLRRAARTELALPQADLEIEGSVRFGEQEILLVGARGAQAHLWGSAHAPRWAWMHCNDFLDAEGEPLPGTVLDAVSVFLERGGRQLGPATPVIGRIEGEDFISNSPLRVLANGSRFALSGWSFTATAGRRRLVTEVDAPRAHLAGVTLRDPDGTPAHCYNTEVASVRVQVLHRSRRVGGWEHRATLLSPGRAHFEYGQREPVAGVEVVL